MKFPACLLLATSVCWCADPTVIEEIVAKVNGDIITRGDLEKGRQELLSQLQERGLKGAELQQAFTENSRHILRERIDQLLLVQKAKDLNINVDPEVSKYVTKLQTDAKIADPEKFQDFVRQQLGVPYEDWKAEVKNQMLKERVIRQEVGGKMNIKHEDVQKYYDEHKSEFVRKESVALREILISTEGKDEAGIAAAEKKAKDLVARARKGEKFPEMARDNSDAITAKQYGELGVFEKGKLNDAVEKAVWSQPKGYVTDPIRISAGFEIYKVEEHYKEGQAPLTDVENEIMERLYAPRMEPAVRAFLTDLRKSAFLEIKPGFVDTGAAPGKSTAWTDPATLKPETTTKAEVASRKRHKKLLGVPLPGTSTPDKGVSTSK